ASHRTAPAGRCGAFSFGPCERDGGRPVIRAPVFNLQLPWHFATRAGHEPALSGAGWVPPREGRASHRSFMDEVHMNASFWKAGHTPTLFAAFLYFDLSFMVWYVLGPLGVQIATDLQLSTQQRAMMVATPILSGAILRLVMGMLADRTSPKT